MNPIFSPGSVAIVGASRFPGSVGRAVFENMLQGGFTGTVYPVNPHTKSVAGVRAYPSIKDLPETVDLAVIIVPAESVTAFAEE